MVGRKYYMPERMVTIRNEYLFSDDILPVRNHQAYDEMLMFQKRFAADIYYQKDLDGRIP
jgi:hypothetical protein